MIVCAYVGNVWTEFEVYMCKYFFFCGVILGKEGGGGEERKSGEREGKEGGRE